MLRAIIIDDELIGIKTLKVLIEKHSNDIKIVATSSEPETGITLIEDYQPDIVFLDISMPGLSGFDLLDQLQFKDFKLIFTTAHEEYALKAIKSRAYDYLLKPIDASDLKKCLSNLVNERPARSPEPKEVDLDIIQIPVNDGVIFIQSKDIIRVEASGSYSIFYLENNIKHIVSRNLKECGLLLDPSLFFRCHASHIINLKKVVKMVSSDGWFVKMSDGSEAGISKKHKDAFLEKFKSI
jgi:two-component system LytT family response regulator